MPRSKGSEAGDQAIEELRSQFSQLQYEIQKKCDEETERQRCREAEMQDLIVSTIID